MQVLASQLHFLANKNAELAIPPLFWSVSCIKIGGHVALLSDPTVYSLYYTVYSLYYTVYSLYYTVYSLYYTVYSLYYTVYSLYYTFHSITSITRRTSLQYLYIYILNAHGKLLEIAQKKSWKTLVFINYESVRALKSGYRLKGDIFIHILQYTWIAFCCQDCLNNIDHYC